MNATMKRRSNREWDRGGEPLGFAAGDANLYRYVGNDPTDATDPTGLVKLEPKSVGKGPQTGLFPLKDPKTPPEFNAYWGVALYLDKAGVDELKQAGGGYIIEKRTIEWNFEGDYIPPNPNSKKGYPSDKKGTVTAWFLDPISFTDGNLNANNDFGSGKGGSRIMDDNSIAAAYFSVINSRSPIPFTKGQITVTVDYQLYSGPPGEDITKQFPAVGRLPEMPSGLGTDENAHKPWIKEEPKISAKPLIKGQQIKATMTWDSASEPALTFESPNTGMSSGPQRMGRRSYFPAWKYDSDKMKWTRSEPTGDENP